MRPAALVIIACALTSAGVAATPSREPSSGGRTFRGSWSAAGRRHTVPTDRGAASVVQLSGAVVLIDGAGATFGFQGQAIGFDDAAGVSMGRAMWTDARGDRVFSILKGETLQTGRRIAGTIAGGTGAYVGVTGEYELTWQYVVSGENDEIQGRTVDLNGRFRPTGKQP